MPHDCVYHSGQSEESSEIVNGLHKYINIQRQSYEIQYVCVCGDG